MKILDWKLDKKARWKASLYGCTKCDIKSKKPLYDIENRFRDLGTAEADHSKCDDTPCFGCKIKGLQLNTGDASSRVIEAGMTQKKWDKELDFYKQARAQGVQPEGTSRKAVENALTASETLGKAYDGGTMPATKHITKGVAEVMKELKQ